MKFLKTILLIFFTLHSTHAFSWAEVGHQVVGEIAEQILVKEKAFGTLSAIRDILGIEPIAVSGLWADQVRGQGPPGQKVG